MKIIWEKYDKFISIDFLVFMSLGESIKESILIQRNLKISNDKHNTNNNVYEDDF